MTLHIPCNKSNVHTARTMCFFGELCKQRTGIFPSETRKNFFKGVGQLSWRKEQKWRHWSHITWIITARCPDHWRGQKIQPRVNLPQLKCSCKICWFINFIGVLPQSQENFTYSMAASILVWTRKPSNGQRKPTAICRLLRNFSNFGQRGRQQELCPCKMVENEKHLLNVYVLAVKQ